MTEAILIRVVGTADAEVISALIVTLTRERIAPLCTPEGAQRLLDSMQAEAVAQRMRDGFPHWVAETEGSIVGVAAIRPPRHLYHLFVAEPQQCRGIARQLWETARASVLASDGPGAISVNASPNSVEVYRHLGFIAEAGDDLPQAIPSTPMHWIAPGARG